MSHDRPPDDEAQVLADVAICAAIEIFYHRQRIHSALGYRARPPKRRWRIGREPTNVSISSVHFIDISPKRRCGVGKELAKV
jgi:hypothetical protein